MSCGVAPNRQGQKEVVLAGGSWDWEVDFYNLETKEWRSSSESVDSVLTSVRLPKLIDLVAAINAILICLRSTIYLLNLTTLPTEDLEDF